MGYRDADRVLYSSLFSKIFLYLHQHQAVQDWRSVLIFLERSLDPGLPSRYRLFEHSEYVQRFYLDELPAALVADSPQLGLLQLIVSEEQIAIDRAKQLKEQVSAGGMPERQQTLILELIKTICIYKFTQLSIEEIEAMLGLSELKQTRVYQEACEETGRSIVLRLLTRRLGDLPEPLVAQINTLSVEQLESLAEALLDFSSLADLEAWLKDANA
jgi:predicted transposase YdaD